MASLQPKLLGGFSACLASGQAIKISGKKNQALLAYLALNPGKKLSRDKLVGLLWSDRGDAQARSSLRQALVALRRDLGGIEPAPLNFEGDTVAVTSSAISTDAAEFERLAASGADDDLRQAATLYEGALMDGTAVRDPAHDEWLAVERGGLQEIAVSTLSRLSRQRSGAEAVATAKRLIALDPLREASHRALMEIHAAQGQRDQAIRRYQACRDALWHELGVEPSKETETLHREISEGSYRPPIAAEATAATRDADTLPTVKPALPLPEKPSIVVLPLENLSGDPEQGYFADGVTENIITGLSRFRDLFVIARRSAFAHKGKAVKVQEACRELGVRYALEGSIQRSNGRVRITVQLVDGATGQHLWAERYDRKFEDIFAVQDEVTETIIGTLATSYGGRLRKAWKGRAAGPVPRDFRAIDYFQLGQEFLGHFTKDDNERARRLFHKAADLDPNYAKPCAKLAWTHILDVVFGWSEDPATSWANALKFGTEATQRDDDEPWGHWALAGYYMFHLGQHDRALSEYRKALELNPNDADVLTDFALTLSYAGRGEEAIDSALKAMRLNPHYPEWYVFQLGEIYHDAGQYEKAIAILESMPSVDTIWIELYLAASYAALGRAARARQAMERALRFDPQVTVQGWITLDKVPYKYPEALGHFRDCLRKAGLPE